MSPLAAANGRKKEQVWILIPLTREYLEFDYHVSPYSAPLQGMQAQPLQLLLLLLLLFRHSAKS